MSASVAPPTIAKQDQKQKQVFQIQVQGQVSTDSNNRSLHDCPDTNSSKSWTGQRTPSRSSEILTASIEHYWARSYSPCIASWRISTKIVKTYRSVSVSMRTHRSRGRATSCEPSQWYKNCKHYRKIVSTTSRQYAQTRTTSRVLAAYIVNLALRKKAVKCRLECACIMIDDRMIFDRGEAEAVLRSLQSPLHVPTSSPGSSPASRNLLKSFAQAASADSQ